MGSALKFKTKNKNRGASLVEYALLLSLIAAIAVPAVRTLGHNVCVTFETAADLIANVNLNDDECD